MPLFKHIILFSLLFCTQQFSSFAQGWSKKNNYPVPAGGDGAIAFELNGKIYAGGGLGSKQFWQYDPVSGNWTRKKDLGGVTTDRSFGLAFAANGKGYVGFGLDGSTRKYDLWEYNDATDSWTKKQDYHGQANDGLFCFVINNKAYIGGGEDAFSGVQYNAVYEYNPVTDDWTPKHNFPTAGVIYPFSFAINGKGYVSCGQETLEVVKTWQYDPVADDWTPRADYTGSARQAGISFVLNGKAYCGLGMDQAGFYKNIYSYNATANAWTPETDYPDTARSFPVAAATSGVAFAGLGWSLPNNLFKSWWQFGTPNAVNNITGTEPKISCYPNPAHNILYLSGNIATGTWMTIYDNAGRLVKKSITGKQKDIDISTLPNGTYTLSRSEAAKTSGVKFIKQ